MYKYIVMTKTEPATNRARTDCVRTATFMLTTRRRMNKTSHSNVQYLKTPLNHVKRIDSSDAHVTSSIDVLAASELLEADFLSVIK